MIKVVPNQVACKKCMTNLEYESSDVIETVDKYPNIEFKPGRDALLGCGSWVVNGYVDVVNKYEECPICKTKIRL